MLGRILEWASLILITSLHLPTLSLPFFLEKKLENQSSILFSKTWKQPKCPSTDEWIKKTWDACMCMRVSVCMYMYSYIHSSVITTSKLRTIFMCISHNVHLFSFTFFFAPLSLKVPFFPFCFALSGDALSQPSDSQC